MIARLAVAATAVVGAGFAAWLAASSRPKASSSLRVRGGGEEDSSLLSEIFSFAAPKTAIGLNLLKHGCYYLYSGVAGCIRAEARILD